MANCQHCKSERVINIVGKCSDCFSAFINDKSHDGYVPNDLGIGGGDYIEFSYCLECGQMQGEFPLPSSKLEKGLSDNDVRNFYEEYISQYNCVNDISRDKAIKIIEAAGRLLPRFGIFIEDFIFFDKSGFIPSVQIFLERYRRNEY